MKRDLSSAISTVSAFLGIAAPQGESLSDLLDHLSFDKMKTNAAVNKCEVVAACNDAYGSKNSGDAFMRKGKTGDWRTKLNREQIERFVRWEEKWLGDSDLKFDYGDE